MTRLLTRRQAVLAPLATTVVGCTRRRTEVAFAMWSGDEARNRHFRGPVADILRSNYGLELRILGYGDIAEFISKLLNEKSAGAAKGSADVAWINGENFRLAKQGGVLHGPFADALPGAALYPADARRRDFGTPINGLEAPWQKAQFVLGYDTARVPEPPRSLDALAAWARSHPGRFTYVAPPDFTGSAFIRHALLHFGGATGSRYPEASTKALAFLRDLRPFLWRNGETYPPSVREQDRLFANQEIDFAMSYGPAFASERMARGEFPATTRTFVFDEGTLSNYSYLAIPFNAPNLRGALTFIEHLQSFDALLDLSKALKSPFPLDPDKLTARQKTSVEALPRGPATLADSVLAAHALPEPDAEVLVRFEKDWQEQVARG